MPWVIRSRSGMYWQTARGFVSHDYRDATKYPELKEAEMVCGFCVPGAAEARIEVFQAQPLAKSA